ncbi:meiosis initiator protein [Diceros bicornis minor]|uniref:meiosis initiator protein n=1 Tax=Diceros bicornis minor TaxID=77932 RepID=UPI0026EF0FA2|nr:meiosis initiator protein [Diceros bicornis minor]
MWDSGRRVCSPERPKPSSLSPSERRQRKNHTSKLRELALLLPVALNTATKKLTKKEILLHVLHYIQYLQRSIDVAKALLEVHTSDGEGGPGGLGRNPAAGPARRRHSTPSSSPHSRKSRLRGACRKPQKKKLTRASERQTQAQNPRRCLALDKPEKQLTSSPDQKGGHGGGTATPPRCPDSCSHPKPESPPPRGDRKGGRSQLTLLEMAENSVHCDISSCYCKHRAQDDGPYSAFEAQHGAERIHFLSRTQPCPRQQLVFYDPSEEADSESLDADPWLPAWIPEGSPHGSPLALGPPQIGTCSATGHPSEILGLSPSLFSSPGKLLPEQILEDETKYLTQALLEEVFLDPALSPSACALEVPEKDTPSEDPEDPPHSHSLCQSSVSLDGGYPSPGENSRAPSSPSSADTDTDSESTWLQQEDARAVGLQSSSDEDGDYTWTPTRRASTLPAAGRKARKGRAGRGSVKPKENKKAPRPTQTKKKCVNGFIMFCRMNRKQYIRACPGTASTAATKELAQLWREMTQQERRPYCTKARRFSRQHNRIVKRGSSSSEDDDWEPPKPFYQLLAEKARRSPDPAPRLPPRRQ